MFRRSYLLFLCFVTCLLIMVSFASKAAKQSNSAALAIPDLSGEWMVTGYSASEPAGEEIIKIEQQGDSITATKVTGDAAIHAGEVTWKGTLKAGMTRRVGSLRFSVQVQMSHGPDFKDRYFVTDTLTIVSSDELRVGKTTLRRNGKNTPSQPQKSAMNAVLGSPVAPASVNHAVTSSQSQKPAANADPPIVPGQTVSFDGNFGAGSINSAGYLFTRRGTAAKTYFFNSSNAPYFGSCTFDAHVVYPEIIRKEKGDKAPIPALSYNLMTDLNEAFSQKELAGIHDTFRFYGRGNGNEIFGTIKYIQGSNLEPNKRQQFIARFEITGGKGVFKGATGTINLSEGFASYEGRNATCHISGTITTVAQQAPVAPVEGPKVGDIVIYRKDNFITHSGIVSQVDPQTGTVLQVESKWGNMGLYKHHPSDVPEHYGAWKIYRSKNPSRKQGNNLLRWDGIQYVTDANNVVKTISEHEVARTEYLKWAQRHNFTTDNPLHPIDYLFDLGVFVWDVGKLAWDELNPNLEPFTPKPDVCVQLINHVKWWGSPKPLGDKLIFVRAPSLKYDCHGYTFTTGGKLRWIGEEKECGAEVEQILTDNLYDEISVRQSREGSH